MFLEQVFGNRVRLSSEEFIEQISKKTNWCFKTVEIRKKMLALAGIGVEEWEVVDDDEI